MQGTVEGKYPDEKKTDKTAVPQSFSYNHIKYLQKIIHLPHAADQASRWQVQPALPVQHYD